MTAIASSLPLKSAEPRLVGRYEVHQEIGRGSSGVVFLARDPLIGRWVALKTVSSELTASPANLERIRRRFLNEARSAGSLNHPAIVAIHDVVEHDGGQVSVAMEYVAGTDLRRRIDEPEPISFEFIARVVDQVAEVLDQTHEQGILHRDIKPANILLAEDGSIKVTDFGIASLMDRVLSSDLREMGTPNYLPPERVLGRDVDHRGDIYSLGVVLYELLTRHAPFHGKDLKELTGNIVCAEYTPIDTYRPDVPEPFNEILSQALAKKPEDRYGAAGEMAHDLRLALSQLITRNDTVPTPHLRSESLPVDPVNPADPADPADLVNAVDEPESSDPEGPVEPISGSWPIPSGDFEPSSESLDIAEAESMPLTGPTDVPEDPEPEEERPGLEHSAGLESSEVTPSAQPSGQEGVVSPSRVSPVSRILLALKKKPLVPLVGGFLLGVVLFAGLIFRMASGGESGATEAGQQIVPVSKSSSALRGDPRGSALADAGVLEAVREDALREAQILDALEEAGAAFRERRLRDARRSVRAALALDPEREESRRLSTVINRALASIDAAKAEEAARLAAEAERAALAEAEAAARKVVVEKPKPVPVVTSTTGELRIDFYSKVPRGALTIYKDKQQFFSRKFRFVEKKNFLRRRGIEGGFDVKESLPAGKLDLRVYLALPNQPSQLVELQSQLSGDGLRTLRLRVDEDGQLAAQLH